MSAIPEQACQLAVLDRLAVLSELDAEIQGLITRIANRAKTDAEGDDVNQLIRMRGVIDRYRVLVAQCHNDCRRGKLGRDSYPVSNPTKTV